MSRLFASIMAAFLMSLMLGILFIFRPEQSPQALRPNPTPTCMAYPAPTGEREFPVNMLRYPPEYVQVGQVVEIEFTWGYGFTPPLIFNCDNGQTIAYPDDLDKMRTVEAVWNEDQTLAQVECGNTCIFAVKIPDVPPGQYRLRIGQPNLVAPPYPFGGESYVPTFLVEVVDIMPTGTVSNAEQAKAIDLGFTRASYQLRSGDGCTDNPDTTTGVGVYIKNYGDIPAQNFEVEVNGLRQTVESLAPNETIRLWFFTYYQILAQIDPDNQIVETDETNNSMQTSLTSPTISSPCTP